MFRRFFLLGLAFLAISVAAQSSTSPSQEQSAIQKVLEIQVDAWNRHDLEGFMTGYWHSPELTFFSGGTETRGWEPTLERYRQRYQANGAAMGTLKFAELQVEVLSGDAAFVRGQWHLTMPDGKEPHGLFTLVLKKFPKGWRIIHDHSSAAQ